MCKDSLYHLERQHLRRVNAEGLQLPFAHHRVSCAVELSPANILFSTLNACKQARYSTALACAETAHMLNYGLKTEN